MEDIRIIGLDADDTLWECGAFYAEVEEAFCELISERTGIPAEEIGFCLDEVEAGNMPVLGYGAKAMTISLIETAIAKHPEIKGDDILKCIKLGKSLLESPVRMHENVESTIKKLAKNYRIVIITQGDLTEQRRKFEISPLSKDIEFIVVPEKNANVYSEILKNNGIQPNQFLMVGDSPKSDILPVIEMGGYAAYLPASKTWSLEVFGLKPSERLVQIAEFKDLLKLLKH